jgi:hypothetical protein
MSTLDERLRAITLEQDQSHRLYEYEKLAKELVVGTTSDGLEAFVDHSAYHGFDARFARTRVAWAT